MDGISEILATYNCVSLDEKIQFELDGVVEKEIKQAYCIENLEFCVSCMDYTTLKVSDVYKRQFRYRRISKEFYC